MDFINRMWNKWSGRHTPHVQPVADIPDDDLTAKLQEARGKQVAAVQNLPSVIDRLLERQRALQKGDRNAAKL